MDVVAPFEHVQPQLDCVGIIIANVDQRIEKLVPGPQKGQHGDDHHRRDAEGQNDAPEDAPGRGAIDARRFIEIARNGHDILAHQKDEEGIAKEGGHDQRQIGSNPSQPLKEHKLRQQCHLPRDHQGGEQQHKENVFAREAHARKGESHKCTG